MLSKKLMTLLQTLSNSKHELNQFRKFVYSPYYNENQEIIQLFDLINKTIKDNSSNLNPFLLEKKQVWKKIYGQVPYTDTKMRRLCSDLNKLAERFLIIKKLEEDPIKEQILLLQSTNSAILSKHFNSSLNFARNHQKKLGYRNANFHYDSYIIHNERHKFIEQTAPKNYYLEHLETADYHLDCFYMTQKLKHYCDALGYANIFATPIDIKLLPQFLEYIKQSDFLKEPSIRAYYLIALMFLNTEEEHYFKKLKIFLRDNFYAFPKQELDTLYIHLKNYCIDKKINIGNSAFFHELFEIFQTLLEKEIIIDNNIIAPQDYKNIITVGLHVQAFEWVENFIQTYTPKLPQDHQENALNYNLAKVYFHQKQYEKVIDQLREVEYKSLIYALGGKLMLLKTYYELKEVRALDSLIESFRIYLRRNRLISRDVQQQYLNVLRFVKKMANVAPYDQKAVAKIREQIDNCKALADKKWILEKVDEF